MAHHHYLGTVALLLGVLLPVHATSMREHSDTILQAIPAVSTVKADSSDTKEVKENRFSIDLNMLTRGELRKGGLSNEKEDDDQATFIIERTLLGMSYEREGLAARLTVQHSGTWGSNKTNSLNIYEAWVHLKTKNGLFARIGRQNLSYDDQRIFGADDWAMTAMSHDALKMGYEGHGHKLHLIGAYNQNPENMSGGTYYTGGLQPYKAMEALWYHYDVPRFPLGVSAVFMNVGLQNSDLNQDTCTYQQQLLGTYIHFHPKRLTAEAAFYYQMGKEEHGIPVGAWMASLKARYEFNDQWAFYAGYDYLSGDKNFAVPPKGRIGVTHHDKVRGFSSINGSHHKFYGAMDFFYITTYVNGFTPGLQNLFAGTTWKPLNRLSVDLAYHYLATATSLSNADRPLGHELEATVSYKLKKDVLLSAGYSFMRGTETMKVLKRASGDRQLQWAWIMLVVSPKIFTTMF